MRRTPGAITDRAIGSFGFDVNGMGAGTFRSEYHFEGCHHRTSDEANLFEMGDGIFKLLLGNRRTL